MTLRQIARVHLTSATVAFFRGEGKIDVRGEGRGVFHGGGDVRREDKSVLLLHWGNALYCVTDFWIGVRPHNKQGRLVGVRRLPRIERQFRRFCAPGDRGPILLFGFSVVCSIEVLYHMRLLVLLNCGPHSTSSGFRKLRIQITLVSSTIGIWRDSCHLHVLVGYLRLKVLHKTLVQRALRHHCLNSLRLSRLLPVKLVILPQRVRPRHIQFLDPICTNLIDVIRLVDRLSKLFFARSLNSCRRPHNLLFVYLLNFYFELLRFFV